jgi:hypothetical protein
MGLKTLTPAEVRALDWPTIEADLKLLAEHWPEIVSAVVQIISIFKPATGAVPAGDCCPAIKEKCDAACQAALQALFAQLQLHKAVTECCDE